MKSLAFGVIVLGAKSNRLEHILPLAEEIRQVLQKIQPGEVIQVGKR